MDEQQRNDLVDALFDRLDSRGAVQGASLLELMRLEQNLADSLTAVRRLTAAHMRAITGPTDA